MKRLVCAAFILHPCSFPLDLCSLLNLCSLKNQDHLLKLTVSTLDYSRDGLARVILSKILTAATDVSRTFKPLIFIAFNIPMLHVGIPAYCLKKKKKEAAACGFGV